MRKGEEAVPELSDDGIGAQVAGPDDSLMPADVASLDAPAADGLPTFEEVRAAAALDPRLAAVLDREQAEAEFAEGADDPLAPRSGDVLADDQQQVGQPDQGTPREQALPDPRTLDFKAMSPAERDAMIARLAQTPEGRRIIAEGWLREQDYTEKNQRRADAEREAQRLAAEYEERLRRLEEAQQAATTPPEPETPPPGLDINRYIRWFNEAQGRQPTEIDWLEYRLAEQERRFNDLLTQQVAPLQQRTQQQELEAMAERFERQMDALRSAYPQAVSDDVRAAIIAELDRTGSTVEDAVELPSGERVSAVEKAFLALYGRSLIASAQAARTAQGDAAKAAPSLPPGAGPGGDLEADLDQTRDDGSIEVVAELQKRDRNLLQRVMDSMRGG